MVPARERRAVLLYLTDQTKAVHIPTALGYSLLVSPDDPDGFLSAIQARDARE